MVLDQNPFLVKHSTLRVISISSARYTRRSIFTFYHIPFAYCYPVSPFVYISTYIRKIHYISSHLFLAINNVDARACVCFGRWFCAPYVATFGLSLCGKQFFIHLFIYETDK